MRSLFASCCDSCRGNIREGLDAVFTIETLGLFFDVVKKLQDIFCCFDEG